DHSDEKKLLQQLMTFCLARLPSSLSPSALAAVRDDKNTQWRLAFLDKDFKTRAFRRATHVDEALLDTTVDGDPLQLSLYAIDFKTCADRDRAHRAVVASKRDAFRIPILTMFRAVPVGHSLAFVVSESVMRPDVRRLLDETPQFLPDKRRCEERPAGP